MDVICLDFGKAFDTFLHNILVKKLTSSGQNRQTTSRKWSKILSSKGGDKQLKVKLADIKHGATYCKNVIK